jgi:hypothetical protein
VETQVVRFGCRGHRGMKVLAAPQLHWVSKTRSLQWRSHMEVHLEISVRAPLHVSAPLSP